MPPDTSRPLPYTIVVVDIERFGDRSRSDLHRVTAQSALYTALGESFTDSGVDWAQCITQDRGDGALVLVPASTPKAQMADRFPGRLASALRRHNAVTAAEARIRPRCCLHHGDVRISPHGIVGDEANFACRLVDAEPLRQALRESPEPVALIVSDSFFQSVIRHEPATRPESFNPVHLKIKEVDATAWIRGSIQPTRRSAGQELAPPATASHDGAVPDIGKLADALLALASIRDEAGRRMVLEMLPRSIAGAVAYHPRARLHVLGLIHACLDRTDGLAALLQVLRTVEGNTDAVRELSAVAEPWLS